MDLITVAISLIDAEWESLSELPRQEVVQYLTQWGCDTADAREAVCATDCGVAEKDWPL